MTQRIPRPAPPLRGVIVTVPTFNEAENVEALLDEILALDPAIEVLVADDDSPDGTWKLVAKRAELDTRVHLLHRRTGRGRGLAGREAFLRALEMDADVVIEMDADFSHPPRYIPALVERLREGFDLVLGSRAVAGGRDVGRPLLRRAITRLANAYIRVVLGLSIRDCNSGFRAWRSTALDAIAVDGTVSAGPAIVQELLYRARRAGLRVAEVPIEFVERERGKSTLTMAKLLTGYLMVLRLRWWTITGKL
jgi:dolichol-phosphate mannosyltransferase